MYQMSAENIVDRVTIKGLTQLYTIVGDKTKKTQKNF